MCIGTFQVVRQEKICLGKEVTPGDFFGIAIIVTMFVILILGIKGKI